MCSLQILKQLCLNDLSNGGRGIRNKIETHLVNPLSRVLFDQNIQCGSDITINAIEPGLVTTINVEVKINEGSPL